jgi:NADPH:quinone reductase-like Zn-dependent oxidoreductase
MQLRPTSAPRGDGTKAVRIHEPTGFNGLIYEEAPNARPGSGDVLVKVAACGITHNELDWPVWTCRAGHRRASVIPGHEVSGVVAAWGYGTAGIAVGDEVFGLTDQLRDGAAAEYVAVEARNMALKPRTVDHVHAAAVPRTGAQVIGTGRGRPRPLATELGADRFIALDADRLEDAAGRADLVVGTIGGGVLAGSPALLRPGGTLVTIKAAAQMRAGREDIKTVLFVQESSRAQLTELARLVDEGHLRPQVGAVYPLAQAVQAYSAKSAGGIPGRTILQP